MNKNIFVLSTFALSLWGCSPTVNNPTTQTNPPPVNTSGQLQLIVKAKAEFDVTTAPDGTAKFELVKKTYASGGTCTHGSCIDFTDVTVTNTVDTQFSLSHMNIPSNAFSTTSTNNNLGNFLTLQLGTLFDNDLFECNVNQKCTSAIIQIYQTGGGTTPGLYDSASGQVIPLLVTSSALTTPTSIPTGSPALPYTDVPTSSLVILQQENITSSQEVVNITDASFTNPNYNLFANMSAAGQGTYTAHIVVEYDLAASGGTWGDTFIPNNLAFANLGGTPTSATVNSNSVTLAGIGTAPATANCVNCLVSVNGGAFAASVTGVVPGSSIQLQAQASGNAATAVTASLTVGDAPTATWSVTTVDPSKKANYTCSGGNQTFTVPAGVTSIYVKTWGAGGGAFTRGNAGTGGGGGSAWGFLPVTPGQSFNIVAGCPGQPNSGNDTYGGGGGGSPGGGSGGGRSAIQSGGDLITAGGGGGGADGNASGGAGGGNGQTGSGSNVPCGGEIIGQGASVNGPGGGNGGGSQYQGGQSSTANCAGGGGGGGFFGGGAGNGNGSGGGGSGHLDGSVLNGGQATGSFTTPANTGDPDWGGASFGAGAYAAGTTGRVVVSW
jgi:hypothetical protein